MTMPTLAPTMPVMKIFAPSMRQPSPHRSAVVRIIDGSEPAPFSAAGSVIRKAERASPRTRGSRKRVFCSGVAALPSRNMLPSSGAITLTATGPSGDRPLFLRTMAVSR
jgi:hypothetical protein